MKKLFIKGLFALTTLSGLLQYFLLPGLVWNIGFPFLQMLLLAIGFKYYRGNKSLKICSLLLALLFLTEIGFSFYSKLNIRTSGVSTEIKVMSYNLFFKNSRPNQVISIIKNNDPDLLFVQELTPQWARELENSLDARYKYKKLYPLRGTHGIGIFSKFKLNEQKILNNLAKKPYAQVVVATINDKKIQLINTHLASPAIAVENQDEFFSLFTRNYQVRKAQIIELNKLAQDDGSKYNSQLLVGDLNTLHSEPLFKRLKLSWTYSNNGFLRWMKFNFPNSAKIPPIMTLDYILGRGKMKFIESKVIEGGSSDHLAIMTKLKI